MKWRIVICALFVLCKVGSNGILIAVIGSYKFNQLPSDSHGEIENHVENIASKLFAASIDFVAIVPKFTLSATRTKYQFESSIVPTDAGTNDLTGFATEAKYIVSSRNASIIWSYEDWTVNIATDLNISMIITKFTSPWRSHNHKEKHPLIWFRYSAPDAFQRWIQYNKHNSEMMNGFILPCSDSELQYMIDASVLLMTHAPPPDYYGNSTTNTLPLLHKPHLLRSLANLVLPLLSSPSSSVSSALSSSPAELSAHHGHNLHQHKTLLSTAAHHTLTLVTGRQSTIVSYSLSGPSSSTDKDKDKGKDKDNDKSLNTRNTLTGTGTVTVKPAGAIMVVGTMTTTPKRLATITGPFGQTLAKLLAISELDKLFLNIPWAYKLRQKSETVELPEALLQLSESSRGRLVIIRCDDVGPATKLLPTLLLPEDYLPSDSAVITFDDDRLYTPEAVRGLLAASLSRPNCVITIAAWSIQILSSRGRRGKPGGPNFVSRIAAGKEGVQYVKAGPVDLVLGFYGVLYRKKFLSGAVELFNYSSHPAFEKHCSWVDDIWFSGHLERLRIPKWTIGNVAESRSDITSLSNIGALSLDMGESVKQNHDNVLCAQAMSQVWNIWTSTSHRRKRKLSSKRRRLNSVNMTISSHL